MGALGIAMLAGCPKPAVAPAPDHHAEATPDAAPPAPAGPWTSTGDGAWTLALAGQDAGSTPDDSFSASPGSFTVERFELPAGVTSARVASIDVMYSTGGTVTWGVRATMDNWYADEALAEVTAEKVATKQWVHHDFTTPATVTGPFWITFTSPSSDPYQMVSVAAKRLPGIDPDAEDWELPEPNPMPLLWQDSQMFGQRMFPAQLYLKVNLTDAH